MDRSTARSKRAGHCIARITDAFTERGLACALILRAGIGRVPDRVASLVNPAPATARREVQWVLFLQARLTAVLDIG